MAYNWSGGKCSRRGCKRPFTDKAKGMYDEATKKWVHVDQTDCGPEQRKKK